MLSTKLIILSLSYKMFLNIVLKLMSLGHSLIFLIKLSNESIKVDVSKCYDY